ncbi:Hypothetical predicted protein [Marmota monax]|uniref:Uncharacterized protein n=1 Tax=Marmota monax TaxID=9995 RepID=A0A5E4AIX8_MARMO|nr:hypothetical protein GHT09_018781 [Marmota monax]VTJ56666.1 Hypothetical predicted protein [Marmota monax]
MLRWTPQQTHCVPSTPDLQAPFLQRTDVPSGVISVQGVSKGCSAGRGLTSSRLVQGQQGSHSSTVPQTPARLSHKQHYLQRCPLQHDKARCATAQLPSRAAKLSGKLSPTG